MRKTTRKKTVPDISARLMGAKTGLMLKTPGVSLRRPRGGRGGDSKRMVSFRFPEDAIAYYSSEAKANNLAQVDVVLEAIYLDRDLGRLLSEMRPTLEMAAAGMGLNLDYDLAQVLAQLVEIALKSLGASPGRHAPEPAKPPKK